VAWGRSSRGDEELLDARPSVSSTSAREQERVGDRLHSLRKCQIMARKCVRGSKSALLAVDSEDESERDLSVPQGRSQLVHCHLQQFGGGKGSELLILLFNYTKQHCRPCDTGDRSRSVGVEKRHT
jgi:hypothetical protein